MRRALLLLSIICFTHCGKDKLTIENYNNFNVEYVTGSGWTGLSYEVYIDTSGIMNVRDTPPFDLEQVRIEDYTLLQEEIDSIKLDLINLTGIKLHDYGFGPDKPTDYPVTVLNYRLGTKEDTARIYLPEENEVPEELNLLISRIDRLLIKYDTQH